VYLNRLGLAVAWGRQTGKTNQDLLRMRWERYSFMKAHAPIYPIYPEVASEPYRRIEVSVRPVAEGHVRWVIDQRTRNSADVYATRHPHVNVGTIGHVDWPTVNLV